MEHPKGPLLLRLWNNRSRVIWYMKITRWNLLLLSLVGCAVVATSLATTVLAIGRTQDKQTLASKTRSGYDLNQKLDEILESQQSILEKFDEALAELGIAKSRASLRRCP